MRRMSPPVWRLETVDLLFTDIGLPAMNGRDLAEEARRRRPKIKVLYTTGYARNAVVHHGRLDPDVQLIAKPFTYADLASKIRQVLDETSETHCFGGNRSNEGPKLASA